MAILFLEEINSIIANTVALLLKWMWSSRNTTSTKLIFAIVMRQKKEIWLSEREARLKRDVRMIMSRLKLAYDKEIDDACEECGKLPSEHCMCDVRPDDLVR